jgi:hypothetical protein
MRKSWSPDALCNEMVDQYSREAAKEGRSSGQAPKVRTEGHDESLGGLPGYSW